MSTLTDLYFLRLNYAIAHNIRGEKLWLSCLLHSSVADVKTRIINYLSTMIVVYSLFCVFAVGDINTPLVSNNNVITTFFLVNASLEIFIMLTMLSASSSIYLYLCLMNDKMDVFVHFIRKFNHWISWFPLYGMLTSNILQITNIIFRLYVINPTLMISQSILGGMFIVFGTIYMIQVSLHIHNMFNDDYKHFPQIKID